MTQELDRYQLRAEFFRAGATVQREPDALASRLLDHIDWVPAHEWATWEMVCRDPRPPIVLDRVEGKLEPAWDPALGRPYLQGFKVNFGDQRSPDDRLLLPLTYLHDAATSAAGELVAAGQLVTGDRCQLRISAHPTPALTHANHAQSLFQVESMAEPLPLQERCLSSRLQRARRADDQPEHGNPVFVPRRVVEEMHGLTRAAGATETGGVLIGHLRIDRAIPEIFLEVTEQIPAVHAQQELTSLTLTPQTWTAVEAAVRLRGQGEQFMGWWHSHPVSQWCAACPEEKRRNCQLRCDFFSAQDKSVQRCCFSRAFHVAMVVSDNGAVDLSTAMYGWRKGTIQRRGFHVL